MSKHEVSVELAGGKRLVFETGRMAKQASGAALVTTGETLSLIHISNQIAAAGLGQGTGDNSNAAAMANLASQLIANGQTPSNYYSNFVSTLGSTVSSVQTENTAQNASVTQLQTQNDALSSVNLNAVSYTHLDVYKRQDEDIPILLDRVEAVEIEVFPRARVVVNERTGTVVIGGRCV